MTDEVRGGVAVEAPAVEPLSPEEIDAFEATVRDWASAGEGPARVAEQIQRLIATARANGAQADELAEWLRRFQLTCVRSSRQLVAMTGALHAATEGLEVLADQVRRRRRRGAILREVRARARAVQELLPIRESWDDLLAEINDADA